VGIQDKGKKIERAVSLAFKYSLHGKSPVRIDITTSQICLISMAKEEKAQAKSYRVHHVVPKLDGGWAVKMDGTAEAIKVFSTKGDAVEFAREISHKQSAGIVIHGHDGSIVSTHSAEQVVEGEARPESGFGCARGLIVVPPNFDEPLEEFSEYI
jgi:formylmethanofuran dehydrogenase subunit C